MAELLIDSKMVVDPNSGDYAVRKENTIIATAKEIAKKAFDAWKEFFKNAKDGLIHIIDVGSKKIFQWDHEGKPVSQKKMSLNEIEKFSSFLGNVGKNIEKGLSKLGKGGKVALVVGAMLLTAAMSQQLNAAKYVETSFDEVVKKAAANPGVQYLYQESGSKGFKMMMAITPETKEASKENLKIWEQGGIISQGDIKPGNKNTCFAIYPLTEEGNKLVKESDDYTVYLDGKTTPETGKNKETGTKQEKSTISISLQIKGGKVTADSTYTSPDGKVNKFSDKDIDKINDANKKGIEEARRTAVDIAKAAISKTQPKEKGFGPSL